MNFCKVDDGNVLSSFIKSTPALMAAIADCCRCELITIISTPVQSHNNNSETLCNKFAEEYLTGSKLVWSPSKKY